MTNNKHTLSPPLNEPTFFILLSLASGSKHGYGVLKDVEETSGGQVSLSTSTLYTALGRLLDQGLVERSDIGEGDTRPGLPRKVYTLTDKGRRALNGEARRLQGLLMAFKQHLGEEHL